MLCSRPGGAPAPLDTPMLKLIFSDIDEHNPTPLCRFCDFDTVPKRSNRLILLTEANCAQKISTPR